jgi:hypothetical protein
MVTNKTIFVRRVSLVSFVSTTISQKKQITMILLISDQRVNNRKDYFQTSRNDFLCNHVKGRSLSVVDNEVIKPSLKLRQSNVKPFK